MADDPLFGPLDAEVLHDLTAISLRLLQRHLARDHQRLQHAVDHLRYFRGDLARYRDHHADVEWIRTSLRGRLQDAPLAAMLVENSTASDRAIRASSANLSAWVLAAVLHRMRRSPGQAAIRSALDATRLLKRSRHPILATFLVGSDHGPKTMEVASAAVATMLQDPRLPRTIRTYLERIHYLLKVALTDRDAIFRQVGKRAESTEPRAARPAPQHLAPAIVPDTLTKMDWLTGGEEDGFQSPDVVGSAEEQDAEATNIAPYAKAKSHPQHFAPKRVARLRLSNMVKAIGRRQLSLGAEADPMTPYEVAQLVQHCLSACNRQTVTILCQLIFGRALDLSSEGDRILADEDGLVYIAIGVELPELPRLLEDEDEGGEREDRLFLDLPYGYSRSTLLQLLAASPVLARDENSDLSLSTASEGLARPYRWGRIARYKADWLRMQGCDAAVIGFLTDESPVHRAQLHYTRVSRAHLIYWHRKYLQEGLGLPNPPFPDAPDVYGSRLHLPRRLISSVFLTQSSQLTLWRKSKVQDLQSIVMRHNAYTLYCLMLLYLATGHRPVGNPFERLGDFDLDSGLIWISDKSSAGERGARLLVLPEAARAQLRHWGAHLEKLDTALTHFHLLQAKARIRAARAADPERQEPLFFLLDGDGSVIELTAAVQRRAFQQILPTAMNWARHLLRSALISRVSGEQIDAWMGHAHYGQTAFKKSSGLGLRDLRQVAQEVNLILAEHEATSEESPL
ncbi:hypothetical protein [Ketogulonicigenium vulgare]|uniref:hypothetical protein n=1 Tax=Ketogulonicigenium vulgare TaxID=92945 RepID=UPI002359B98B|nr:hypothetical protein [Ketogulonicigenium vulgare]